MQKKNYAKNQDLNEAGMCSAFFAAFRSALCGETPDFPSLIDYFAVQKDRSAAARGTKCRRIRTGDQ